MNNRKPDQDAWDPCHPGLLHEASQDASIGRRRWFSLAGAAVLIALVGGYVVMETFSTERPPVSSHAFPAGISCISVIDHLPAMFSHEIEDEDLKKRLRCHLLKCAKCRQQYDTMRCCKNQCKSRPVQPTLKPVSIDAPTP